MKRMYCKIVFFFLTVWIYVVLWICAHFQKVATLHKWKERFAEDSSSLTTGILRNKTNFTNMMIGAPAFSRKRTPANLTLNISNTGLFCAVQSDWNSRYFSKTVTTNFKSWTFRKKQNCSSFRLEKTLNIQPKLTFSFKCKGKNVTVHHSYTENENVTNSNVFCVKFGDICLQTYINKCCKDNLPVPNVVHYVIYGKEVLSFYEFVSFISVIRFVRPCTILIHGDTLPTGDYWNYIVTLSPNIVHVRREPPSEIFGQEYVYKEHASDLMRIEALLLYGGIYLDTDTLIVKSLEPFRKYPCTMSPQSSGFMSSAFIMAEQNATFLQKWLDGYKYHYKVDNYVYNAMVYSRYIAREYKDFIHIEKAKLSRPWGEIGKKIYYTNCIWKDIYGIHLFSRGYRRVMNIDFVKGLNSTVGSICRHILFGNKELCIK